MTPHPPRFPALPEIASGSPLSERETRTLFRIIRDEGLISAVNTFHVQGREKWERPEAFRAKEIRLTRDEPPGGDAGAGLVDLGAGRAFRAQVVTDQDEGFPLKEVREAARTDRKKGMVLLDARDRAWFYPTTGQQRNEDPPFQVNGETAPLVAAGRRDVDGEPFDIARLSPLAGTFLFSRGALVDLEGDRTSLLSFPAGERRDLMEVMREARRDMEARVARQERIEAVFDASFTPDRTQAILDAAGVDEGNPLYPGFNDHARRDAFDGVLGDLVTGFLKNLRAEGMLAPCPNNGPRDVPEMTAWNALIEGRLDGDENTLPLEDRMRKTRLLDAPGASILNNMLVRTSVDVKKKAEDEGRAPRPEDYREAMNSALESARQAWSDEVRPLMIGQYAMRSSLDGGVVDLTGSILEPVLGTRDRDDPGRITPLPVIKAPAPARHLTLDLPSGCLVMADWFRIEGFKEGLETLVGDDDFEINTSEGLDDRARAYYEKAGLVIVQVGNTSPHAYADTPGVWRMGYVDEDHDAFWTEDREPAGDAPEPAWGTCTDLWANVFGDKDAVTGVMMASGLYDAPEDAVEALDAYLCDTYGANEIRMDTGRLHVYMPTGYGVSTDAFPDGVRATELDYPDWREDAYLIADRELDMDPDLLEDHGWSPGGPKARKADDDLEP